MIAVYRTYRYLQYTQYTRCIDTHDTPDAGCRVAELNKAETPRIRNERIDISHQPSHTPNSK